MAKFIAIYGSLALICAVIGGITAAVKRRDVSYWMTVCLLLPPLLIVLAMMPRNRAPRARGESWDDQEAREYGQDDSDKAA